MSSGARWGAWATLGWSVAIMAAFALVQFAVFRFHLAAAVAAGADAGSAARRLSYDGDVIAAATLVTALLGVPLVVGVMKLKRGSRLADYLPLHPPARRVLLGWLGVTAVALAASDLASWLLGRPLVPEVMQAVYASADRPLLLVAALVLAAPLFEEVLFRGFLLAGLVRSRLGPAGSVALSAAAWAALHLQYDWYGITTIVVFGLLLGAARVHAGTVLVPLVLHAGANALATLETALLAGTG